jgi:hypothetical protein
VGSKPPYTFCPVCGAAIRPIWWQTILVKIVMCLIAFGLPAYFGLGGLSLFLMGTVLLFPAMLVAIFIIFKNVQPKYARRGWAPPALFIKRNFP